ncbi:MAG: hypothetical protein AAGL49_10555, partial [Pseudomonadota bacterium]
EQAHRRRGRDRVPGRHRPDANPGLARDAPGLGLTVEGVLARIRDGAQLPLGFDWPQVGHPECNRYASCLTAGDAATPLFDDAALFTELFEAGRELRFDRHRKWKTAATIAGLALRRPRLTARAAAFGVRKLWALRSGLRRSRGRVNKLTYYVHNFMDAAALDRERCETCVFMTATRDGPVSMCVHNAKRDVFILQPVTDDDGRPWRPDLAVEPPLKKLKGRARQARLQRSPG